MSYVKFPLEQILTKYLGTSCYLTPGNSSRGVGKQDRKEEKSIWVKTVGNWGSVSVLTHQRVTALLEELGSQGLYSCCQPKATFWSTAWNSSGWVFSGQKKALCSGVTGPCGGVHAAGRVLAALPPETLRSPCYPASSSRQICSCPLGLVGVDGPIWAGTTENSGFPLLIVTSGKLR
jgi:hypothetical protein